MANKTEAAENLDWIKGSAEPEPEDAIEVSGALVLESSLGIAEAEAMYQKMSDILAANVDIEIDAEALSVVDTAGIQLLYGFVKEAKTRSIAVQWKVVPSALSDAAEGLALGDVTAWGSADA